MGAKVGSFNTGTGTSDIVVSGVGGVPKFILFWWSGLTGTADNPAAESSNAVAGDLFLGYGWTKGAGVNNNHAIIAVVDDTNAAGVGSGGMSVRACVLGISTADAVDGRASLKTFDADGFTLQVDDAFPADRRVHYLALYGTAVDQVAIGDFDWPAAGTGTLDVTGLGFNPAAGDLLLLMTAQSADPGTTDAVTASWASVALGAAMSTAAADNMCAATVSEVAAATSADTQRWIGTGECLVTQSRTGSTTINNRAVFSAWITDGFQINRLESTDQSHVCFAVLKGGQYKLDNFTTPTTDGNDAVRSGYGFEPDALLLLSGCAAFQASNTGLATAELSVGGASGPTASIVQRANWYMDLDAAANMTVRHSMQHDRAYLNWLANATSTTEGYGTITSFDAGGFTMDMTDGDPVASGVLVIAFGDAAGATPVSLVHSYLPPAIIVR